MLRALLVASTILFSSAFATNARAGIMVEPYLGYNLLVSDFTFGAAAGPFNGQSLKIDNTGLGYGLRVGYTVPFLFAALDYSSGSLASSVKEKPAGSTISTSSSTATSLGATVGVNLPIIRPYIGYIFDDQVKSDTSTIYGTGFKVGVGLTVFPMVKLNAEYVTRTWTKSKGSSGTEESFGDAATYKSGKGSGFFINASIPLSF
ncbi:MAG TPA: hypothetical protein PLZ57_03325 [Pseudobdellovibrionaceae bacterium]|nr:hypothetical protein [Pseudobdellovibrionaceae bacterium]